MYSFKIKITLDFLCYFLLTTSQCVFTLIITAMKIAQELSIPFLRDFL